MPTNKDISNEEIDLLDLFRRTGKALSRFFSAIGKAILVSIVFLVKRWLLLALSLLFSIIFSYIIKTTFTPYYSSDLTLKSNTVKNADMISYLNRVHSFCLERNIAAIKKALSLEDHQVKNLRDIEAFWVIDKNRDGSPDFIDYKNNYNVYDTIDLRMFDRIVVRAKFSSIGDIEPLRIGLFSFVNTNSFFKQENDLRLMQVNEMLERLNYDIEQLDSLQKIKYFEETKSRMPEKNGQMIFLQEQKTQLIYDEIHKLFIRKQLLDQEKALFPDIITLISDFTLPAKPYTGLLYYGKIFIPLFMGLTILILIIMANREKLKDILRKY